MFKQQVTNNEKKEKNTANNETLYSLLNAHQADTTRWPLYLHVNRTICFSCFVERKGVRNKKSNKEETRETLLLKDIQLAENKHSIIDHMWIDAVKGIGNLPLQTKIYLRAQVKTYVRTNGVKSFKFKKVRNINNPFFSEIPQLRAQDINQSKSNQQTDKMLN